MEAFDLIIIGAGPAGLCCAIEAEKQKLSYLVIEKGVLVNSIYHFPTNMTFFSTSQNLEIGDVPFISHSDKPTRREALEYYRRIVESGKLKTRLYEKVIEMEPCQGGHYKIITSKGEYLTQSVVVATGFYDLPKLLHIPGENLPKVKHYYDDAHPYVGQKVLVIGGANSACDVALETYYKGAEVTMAIREDKIYEKVKYWIRPNIVNRIEEGAIKAFFNTLVKEIRPKEVLLQNPEGLIRLENDFVLAMTGYQPDYPFFEKLGLRFLDDRYRAPVMNPETYETNMQNVYIAGVIQAGLHTSKLFIENTRHHGEVIIADIAKKRARVKC